MLGYYIGAVFGANIMEKEILDRIEDVTIDCPECEHVYNDDQYSCATCWCQGGQGKIKVMDRVCQWASIEKYELIETIGV